MSPESERLARVAISVVAEPGQESVLREVREQGVEATLEHLAASPTHAPRFEGLDARRVLDDAARAGLRFVTPSDAEWPRQLDDLDQVPGLNDRGGVPVGLWVRGPLRLDRIATSVAVVGSRAATTYGGDVAAEVAAAVGRSGRCVVSGAAFGIDKAAHRGAISAGGPTIAVLACGADRCYPTAHDRLIERIAADGAVVSETPPGGAPMRVRFLARNRLIAALTVGTVVAEAAVRSGALNTAHWADRLSRHVLGVPGAVTSKTSAGVHQLIRSGAALLVTSGAEVLEVVAAAGEHLQAEPRDRVRARDLLDVRHQQVLDAVPVSAGATEASIARTAGLGVAEVRAALVTLRGRGLVDGDTGGWRLAALAHE